MADAASALAAAVAPDADGVRTVRVLTLGDSLTAGYSPPDTFTPYATELQPLLQAAVPDGVRVAVTVLGYSGFTTARILAAADSDVEVRDVLGCDWPALNKVLTTHRFHLVVVMSGTNDLAGDFPDADAGAAAIVADLKALHAQCHTHGVPTLALPIPDSKAVTAFPSMGLCHAATNQLLKATATGGSEWHPEQPVAYADVSETLPAVDGDGKATEWMSFDGLHLSPAGYKRLAEVVAPHVVEALGLAAPAGK